MTHPLVYTLSYTNTTKNENTLVKKAVMLTHLLDYFFLQHERLV